VIRLVGSVLLIACGWLAGYSASQKQRERLRQWMLLESYLDNLKAELEYTHAPFEQIAHDLAQNPIYREFPFASFCGENICGQPFFQLFREGVKQNQKIFGNEICACLEVLSGQLGNYPAESQAASIGLCTHQINRICEMLRSKMTQNIKLYQSLGLLGGTAVVILLW